MRIELTTPDGRTFEVDPSKIVTLTDAMPGLMAPSVKSVLTVEGVDGMQGVRETRERIRQLEAGK